MASVALVSVPSGMFIQMSSSGFFLVYVPGFSKVLLPFVIDVLEGHLSTNNFFFLSLLVGCGGICSTMDP